MFQIAELSYAWVQPGTAIVSAPFAQPPAWDLRLRDAVGSDAPVQLRVGAAGYRDRGHAVRAAAGVDPQRL